MPTTRSQAVGFHREEAAESRTSSSHRQIPFPQVMEGGASGTAPQTVPLADYEALKQQNLETMRALQELTAVMRSAGPPRIPEEITLAEARRFAHSMKEARMSTLAEAQRQAGQDSVQLETRQMVEAMKVAREQILAEARRQIEDPVLAEMRKTAEAIRMAREITVTEARRETMDPTRMESIRRAEAMRMADRLGPNRELQEVMQELPEEVAPAPVREPEEMPVPEAYGLAHNVEPVIRSQATPRAQQEEQRIENALRAVADAIRSNTYAPRPSGYVHPEEDRQLRRAPEEQEEVESALFSRERNPLRQEVVEDNNPVHGEKDMEMMIERVLQRKNLVSTSEDQERGRIPFTSQIMEKPLPSKFKMPQINPYTGKGDPYDHVQRYEASMLLHGCEDAIMCRAFSLTLSDHALSWFNSLPEALISSFQ